MPKVKDVFGLHIWPPENEIGLEIEMEGEGLFDHKCSGWSNDMDGSLRGHGVEFILNGPLSEEGAYKKLDSLYKMLKKHTKITPSDRCGVHIHINCQHMEIEQVFNYITLYLILEDLILSWCGEDREGNLFCLRARDAEWLVYSLIDDKKNSGIFNIVTNRNTFKYGTINVAAIRYYGSLEFRSLRTPKTSQLIKDYISLLLRIKSKALEVKDASEFISDCSAKGEIEWAKKILGPHFDMLKNKNMNEKIMEGVRRIQTLAYTPLKKIKDVPKRKRQIQREDGELVRVNVAPGGINLNRNLPNYFDEPIREAPIDEAERPADVAEEAPQPEDLAPRRRIQRQPPVLNAQRMEEVERMRELQRRAVYYIPPDGEPRE